MRLATSPFPILLLTVAAATLGACSTTSNPRYLKFIENSKGVQGATACCESMAAVLARAAAPKDGYVMFDATSTHLDFGDGLAPFFAFPVGDEMKVLEIESPLQLLGWAYGGDGNARYVEAKAIFVAQDGTRLETVVLDRVQRGTEPIGARSLFFYIAVPADARHAIITTDPRRNGQSEIMQFRNPPPGRLTSSSRTFSSYRTLLPMGFRSASYGPLRVRALPND